MFQKEKSASNKSNEHNQFHEEKSHFIRFMKRKIKLQQVS